MILIMQGQPGGRDRYMEGAWHGRRCAVRAVANFFHFTVDTDTATKGGVSGGGLGCSVGPVTLSA